MKNVTIINKEGNRVQGVVVGENPDGSAELTFQAAGGINQVTAEKQEDGTYTVRKENHED